VRSATDAMKVKSYCNVAAGPHAFIAIGGCPWWRSDAISLSAIAHHKGPGLDFNVDHSFIAMRYRYRRSHITKVQVYTLT